MAKTTIIIRKFPSEFPPTTYQSCNDPKNRTGFKDHNRFMKEGQWCPACGETTVLNIFEGDWWQLGIADDGELVVALRGSAGSTLHVFNYERYSYEEPRRVPPSTT